MLTIYVRHVTGIYFVLFGSSVKVLLNKRKTISSAGTLLALAGVFGALITWVGVVTTIHLTRKGLPLIAILPARHHGQCPDSLCFQARPGTSWPRPLLCQRRLGLELGQDFPLPHHHDPLRCFHGESSSMLSRLITLGPVG
jgi:hypothetical protein